MQPLYFGLETEYALAVWRDAVTARTKAPCETDEVALRIVQQVARRHDHLRDRAESGLFLGNGARLYVDAGAHPEYSSPECLDPWELVRAQAAGDALLTDAAACVEAEIGDRVRLGRHNVDYIGAQSWGSHESYLHESDPPRFWDQLLPHLVTRILYTGAGGFDASEAEAGFVLSPRVAFLHEAVSSCTQELRGIVNTKNEPLSDEGLNRLHLVCGESLVSQTASLLRFGTTALLVRQIDAGRSPAAELHIARPLRAMRLVSRDPSLSRGFRLMNGRHFTALETQYSLLAGVERDLDEPWMPGWAERLCAEWRTMLDLLAEDVQLTVPLLDWAAKQALTQRHLARPRSDPRSARTRAELFELDARFSQLGPDGLAPRLVANGMLAAPLFDGGSIEHSRHLAPTGRAARRGALIRQLARREPQRYTCNWSGIFDLREARRLSIPLCVPPGGEETDDASGAAENPAGRIWQSLRATDPIARMAARERAAECAVRRASRERSDPAQADLPF